MDEKEQFWNVFAKTGRVEDYLRYCRWENKTAAEEVPVDEDHDRRPDHSRGPRGGIG